MAKAKATKKAATKQMAPNEIEELLGQIEKAEKTLDNSELEWTNQKDALKAAKSVRDQAVADLRSLCRTRERWLKEEAKQPLLAKSEEAGVSVTIGDTTFSASHTPQEVAAALVSDVK